MNAVTGEVPRILKETLMLLKPLKGMHFKVLHILSRRQSLLASLYVSHNSSSASNVLGRGKSSLKRLANKLNFSFQLALL